MKSRVVRNILIAGLSIIAIIAVIKVGLYSTQPDTQDRVARLHGGTKSEMQNEGHAPKPWSSATVAGAEEVVLHLFLCGVI